MNITILFSLLAIIPNLVKAKLYSNLSGDGEDYQFIKLKCKNQSFDEWVFTCETFINNLIVTVMNVNDNAKVYQQIIQ